MQIVERKANELHPYDNNPRVNDEAVELVANSIREFGFKVPVVIDAAGTIVCGHTRVKAVKRLYGDDCVVPCIVADDLTPEQIRAFRLADNKVAEKAGWDEGKLAEELSFLSRLDMSAFGFEEPDLEGGESQNEYTNKVEIPKYEAKEEFAPELSELYDRTKQKALSDAIRQAPIPDDIKGFLEVASYRHIVFDYGRIAEYYCHASKDVQRLMEDSALVLIDFDRAIELGYVAMKKAMDEDLGEDGE